ncbi:hypothetical protein EC9_17940 [Rosistilla ulvae]|uniref:FAD-dependent urate hydroxylase HpyO/Asp monooxygenase CreE-like FAD/NAD(P)-binding domain-containing protein n=1 Tax=Rosistilla ulvae TaxID=1930277 RepID=A0A517LYB0_9BACT|nr:FAD/NAD(P)-binding domain-containing protein [Rosistilla ulvae]QDS87615.1 hypothetical protein EC9_17940 [Rosistilla ulvae]
MSAPLAASVAVGDRSNLSHGASRFRIGIVGCGPRGLYCLQSLSDELRRNRCVRSLSIDIFEPSEFPGAGNVYASCQPHYLKMNFAAKHINAWADLGESGAERLDFVGWLKQRYGTSVDPNGFAPRAVVGEYLHDCYRKVYAELEEFAQVTLHGCRVSRVDRRVRRWVVQTDRLEAEYDELVLTVGHEGWRTPQPSQEQTKVEFIPAFPIRKNLSVESIRPGETVAIRGYGLTWIDVTLALTTERSGAFIVTGDNWRYLPSGCEPRRIIPFSRSGRPMLAKPNESLFPQPAALDAIWERGRDAIDALQLPIHRCDRGSEFWQILTQSAAAAVNHFRDRSFGTSTEVQNWFDDWCRGTMKPATSLAAMRRSFRVATGREVPDVGWAMGAAWRNLYPAIVRQVSYGGLAADQWKTFWHIAAEMERIAFGPPADNVGRMLALIDAGIVDLRFLTSELQIDSSRRAGTCTIGNGIDTVAVDRCVDAVLPSPLQLHSAGPLQGLLEARTIRRLHGSEGIEVDRLGRPVTEKGRVVDVLSIIGRSTEGCVLGNDTLSRTLHDQPQRWAAEVATKIQNRKENE